MLSQLAKLRTSALEQAVYAWLREYAADPARLAAHMGEVVDHRQQAAVQKLARLQRQVADIQAAIRRWDDAYAVPGSPLSAADWAAKVAPLKEELARVQEEMAGLVSEVARQVDHQARIRRLQKLCARLEELASENPRLLKARLQRLIEAVVVEEGQLVQIRFR